MDTRYFGTSLLALGETETKSRKLTEAGEDDYYRRHTPADGKAWRINLPCASVCIGLVALGWAML